MSLKICLILKKNKKYNDKVVNFLKNKNLKTDIFKGSVGNKLPEKIKNKKYDVIISYLSPWILSEKILKRTSLYNINFHPGPPKYPGIGCFNFALLNGETSYGVTMHIMSERVDSGRIIKTKYFSSKKINLLQLIDKSYEKMFELFKQEISKFLKYKKIKFSKEKWKRKAYNRIDLNNLCKLNLDMSPKQINRRINAIYHPKYPLPYFIINKKKINIIPD